MHAASARLGTRTGLAWNGIEWVGNRRVVVVVSHRPPTQPCALGTCPTPQSQSSLYFSKEPASHALRMRSRRPPPCLPLPLCPAALSIFSLAMAQVTFALSKASAASPLWRLWKFQKRQRLKGVTPPSAPSNCPLFCCPSLCENIFPSIFLLAQQFPS